MGRINKDDRAFCRSESSTPCLFTAAVPAANMVFT
jgi:hypothetical protein